MDRRQQKTREAIFGALHRLLAKRGIFDITVQDLLDEANVGRSTFYAHFETKEEMLRQFSRQIFHHVFANSMPVNGLYDHTWFSNEPGKGIASVLYAIRDDKERITEILTCSCEGGDMFLDLFRKYIYDLMDAALKTNVSSDGTKGADQGQYIPAPAAEGLPEDFLVNHIAGSFVNMIQWWIKNKMKQSPEEMVTYFEKTVGMLLPSGFLDKEYQEG